jgi:hypothetical protein
MRIFAYSFRMQAKLLAARCSKPALRWLRAMGVVVSPDEWTFVHHPRARTFPTLEAAVAAIMARQSGEAGLGRAASVYRMRG